jgi:hypothetical protein
MCDARAREPGNPLPRVAADLPVATEEQRADLCAAWSIRWPDSSKMFPASKIEHETMCEMIGHDALAVLGRIIQTHSIDRDLWDRVRSALGKWRHELAWRRAEGNLSHEAMANVLAAAEIQPLDVQPPTYEISDELLEEGKWL